MTIWLLHAGVQYQLGDTYPEKFPMNGKALIMMTRDMFISRVPEGGGLLFEDVQLKLQKVITELYKKTPGSTSGRRADSPCLDTS